MKLLFMCLLVLFATTSAQPTAKIPGCKTYNCFVDPCQFAECPAFPKAECQSDYCGGCKARFYVKSKEVDCNLKDQLKSWK